MVVQLLQPINSLHSLTEKTKEIIKAWTVGRVILVFDPYYNKACKKQLSLLGFGIPPVKNNYIIIYNLVLNLWFRHVKNVLYIEMIP